MTAGVPRRVWQRAVADVLRRRPSCLHCRSIGSGAGITTTRTSSTNISMPKRGGMQAKYELDFKKYEKLPQPKITAVDAQVDIDPAHRSFSGCAARSRCKTRPRIRSRKFTSPTSRRRFEHDNSTGHFIWSAPARAISIRFMRSNRRSHRARPQMTFNVGYHARVSATATNRPSLLITAHSSTPAISRTSVTTSN